jgi:hypothetical protein
MYNSFILCFGLVDVMVCRLDDEPFEDDSAFFAALIDNSSKFFGSFAVVVSVEADLVEADPVDELGTDVDGTDPIDAEDSSS